MIPELIFGFVLGYFLGFWAGVRWLGASERYNKERNGSDT